MRRAPLVFALILAACGGGTPGGRRPAGTGGSAGSGGVDCPDEDGDGFADPACGGDDCDDRDPTLHPGAPELCDDGVDQDCDGAPDGGCTCTPGDMRACWGGDPGQRGTGTCTDGRQRCGIDGQWSACEGAVMPAAELACDGFDQDCSGTDAACACPGTEICGNGLDDDCDGARDEPDFCAATCLAPEGEPMPEGMECCDDPARLLHAYVCRPVAGLPPCGERACEVLDGNPGTVCRRSCSGDTCLCGLDQGGQITPSDRCGFPTPCARLGCELRLHQPCYSGNPVTLGVGACRGGFADCVETDGARAWGACAGEVLPASEVCGNGVDDDCDGRIDEDDGAGHPCPPERTCAEEVCGNGLDDDCDGFADEACRADASLQACWTGAPEQSGVGACLGGTQIPDEHGRWAPCKGEVLPSPDVCGDGVDSDCNGRGGTFDREEPSCCVAAGTETCNGVDDDCDGLADEGLVSWCGTCGECAQTVVIDDPGDCTAPLRTCVRIKDEGGATPDPDAPGPTCDSGILVFELGGGLLSRVEIADASISWSVTPPPYVVASMACDGSFWLSGGDVLEHRDRDGRMTCSAMVPLPEQPVAVDDDGTGWIVDEDGRLRAFGPDGGPACPEIDLPRSLPRMAGSAQMGPEGKLWIAGETSYVFNTRTLEVEAEIDTSAASHAEPRVDPDGNLWSSRPLTRFSPHPGDPSQTWPPSLLHLRFAPTTVWGINTFGAGAQLLWFDADSGEQHPIALPEGYRYAWDPIVDVQGHVWTIINSLQVGTNLGEWDPQAGSWTIHPIRPSSGTLIDRSHRSAAALQTFKRGYARWTQDIDAGALTARWDEVRWEASTGAGGHLDVSARFAGVRGRLDQAPPCRLEASPARLEVCPGSSHARFLRVEVRMREGRTDPTVLKRVEVDLLPR